MAVVQTLREAKEVKRRRDAIRLVAQSLGDAGPGLDDGLGCQRLAVLAFCCEVDVLIGMETLDALVHFGMQPKTQRFCAILVALSPGGENFDRTFESCGVAGMLRASSG